MLALARNVALHKTIQAQCLRSLPAAVEHIRWATLKPSHAQILQASSRAQDCFATKSQEDADRIFDEVAKLANKARVPLAAMAEKEARMGCFEDSK